MDAYVISIPCHHAFKRSASWPGRPLLADVPWPRLGVATLAWLPGIGLHPWICMPLAGCNPHMMGWMDGGTKPWMGVPNLSRHRA